MVNRTLKSVIRTFSKTIILKLFPEMRIVLGSDSKNIWWYEIINRSDNSIVSEKSCLHPPYHLERVNIGDYSYLDRNSWVSMTRIGKFCSIGMNFVCGRGIHPTNGISTSPYFYSEQKQNGFSISKNNKFKEREWIEIGNDVFIGMNVTVLDGIQIGNGAVIGAGAVVSKDVPPYAIAVGCPIRIIGYRFDEHVINELLRIKWWEKDEDHFKMIEELFFDVDEYISLLKKET